MSDSVGRVGNMAPIDINNQEISSITLNGNTEIDTVEVNGQTVFSAQTFLESFERANPLSIYSGDTGKFAVDTAPVFDGSKSIRSTDTNNYAEIVTQDITVSQGSVYQYRHYHRDTPNDPNGGLYFGMQGTDLPAQGNGSGYKIRVQAYNNTLQLSRYDNGATTNIDVTGINIDFDNWMKIRIDWQTNGDIECTAFDSGGSQLASVNGNDSTYTSGGIGFENYEGGINFDYVEEI